MAYHFKNLVFEGGGVKGIAYIGAMDVLESKGILQNIVRVGGTSTGAINAVLLGLGYTTKETLGILMQLNFRRFLDDTWGIIRDTKRLIEKYGWYKGDFFRKWIADIIERKTGNSESTFADINSLKESRGFRDIYVMGTNLSTEFAEIFSYEHTPRMCLADAVRISMSIPLFFTAVRSPRGDVYVDGGVLNNYPIKLFDRMKYVDENYIETDYYSEHNNSLPVDRRGISRYVYNKETLGFRLDSAREIAAFRDQAEPVRYNIDDFFTYLWSLIDTVKEFQNNIHLHSDDWQRTIYIDTYGVKTTDFDLDNAIKEKLRDSGIDCTKNYFKWFDAPQNAPVNRV